MLFLVTWCALMRLFPLTQTQGERHPRNTAPGGARRMDTVGLTPTAAVTALPTRARTAATWSNPLHPEPAPMASFILDTLAYADTLKAGGFSPQQAETQARALAEILDRQMASKAEVAEHENNLQHAIEVLRLEMKRDIAETKADLTRWVIGAGVLQTTIVVGVLLKVAKLV